jgi:plasmid stabilization system protein ParE
MHYFKVLIRDNAFDDLQEIIDYYNSRQDGLGKRFFDLFQHALEILKINPFFQVRFDAIRSIPLHSFPYSIYFDVDENKNFINIYAILHQAQDPEKIHKRFQ